MDNPFQIATLTKEVSAYAEQLAELGEDLKTILSSLNETMETFESGKDKRMYMRFKRDSAATVDLVRRVRSGTEEYSIHSRMQSTTK